MKMSYDFLKQNVAMVEVIKEINMGPAEDFLDQVNGMLVTGLFIDENDNAIICPGAKGKICVQPHNHHYEMTIDGYWFDICFDTDEDLNDTLSLIEVVGPNKYFAKEGRA